MDLIMIYDFDGTLTPYAMPQYKVLKDCGYDDEKVMGIIQIIMDSKKIGLYEAYVEAIFTILERHHKERTIDTICDGAEEIIYNPGVISYFEKFKDVNHYVVTSGYEDYVRKTKIYPYLKDIFGTRITIDNSYMIDQLMTDEKKVDAIGKIVQTNSSNFHNVIYIGDGLTDCYAFEYVHKNGGISIFVGELTAPIEKLCQLGIIDYCFERNFEVGSSIDKYIQSRLEGETCYEKELANSTSSYT